MRLKTHLENFFIHWSETPEKKYRKTNLYKYKQKSKEKSLVFFLHLVQFRIDLLSYCSQTALVQLILDRDHISQTVSVYSCSVSPA